jgi:hypothetical protein
VTNLRASDDDRAQVVAALERHTAAGRLSLDEFSDRVDQVYRAVTHAELSVVTHDLPVESAPSAAVETPRHRELLVAFLIAAITVVVLGVVLTVGR